MAEHRVTIGQLGTDNYQVWSRRMQALLQSKKLWSVIKGDEDDADKSEQVKGILVLYLDDYHLQMADDALTAKELWEKLEATFKAGTNARRLLLRQQLNSLRKEHKEPITQYISRAKGIASNLKSIGQTTEDKDLVLPIMAGLPKEYSVLVTVVGASKTEHTLEEVLAMLLTHEQQISSEVQAEPQSVPIYGAGSGGRVCYYCQKAGHIKADCPKRLAKMNIRRTVAF